LLGLGQQASVLKDWSEKAGISQAEIVRQMIQKQDDEIPDFLKKKERKPSFTSKYEAARADKGSRLYLGEFSEQLLNYKINTGESVSFLVRNLIAGAIKSSPDLFQKRD